VWQRECYTNRQRYKESQIRRKRDKERGGKKTEQGIKRQRQSGQRKDRF